MKSEWPQYSLSEVCKLVVDCQHASPKWTNDGFIVLRNHNIKNGRLDLSAQSYTDLENYIGRIKRAKPQAGDLVITREAPMGEVCLIPEGLICCLGQRQVLLRPDPMIINSRYLLYTLQSPYLQNQISWNEGTGSTVSNLRIPVLEELKIPTPNLAVQKEVAETLGALDDRITLLRETNTTLEAIAQALFKSWFIDFDPVHAKMQGQAPQGMDEATATLFPDTFEESELGPIPKGWKVGVVSDLGEVICGKTPPTSNPENYGQDVPFITIPDMHNNLVITNTVRSLSKLGANSQNKKYLPEGSICVSCIATAGLVSRVTRPSQTNQQINSVIPYTKWGKSFPLFLLRRIGDSVRAAGSGGSVFHNLNKSGFEKINVLLTSLSIAKIFDGLIEPIIEKIESNQNHIQNLESIRDELLPRLITGQIAATSIQKEFNA